MLTLGSFTFDIDDYPEELPIGGSSLVSVEKFPGGHKTVQNFGAFDDTIQLKGTFLYSGALDKVRAIDAMWRAGDPVQLVVGSLMPRWVTITAFKPVYKNDYYIDYQIDLEKVDSDDPNAILYGDQGFSPGSSTSSSGSSSGSSGGDSSSTTGSSSSGQSGSPQITYTVQQGDTLWGIASKPNVYGDGSQYTKLVSANDIKDPGSIYPGQQLVVPA